MSYPKQLQNNSNGYDSKTGEVDLMESLAIVYPRKLAPSEVDERFPFRLVLDKRTISQIKRIPKKTWEDICNRCGMCCHGAGTESSNTSACRYKLISSECAIYPSPQREQINCPDIRQQFIDGTFPWTAYYKCAYWKKFHDLTDVKYKGMGCVMDLD